MIWSLSSNCALSRDFKTVLCVQSSLLNVLWNRETVEERASLFFVSQHDAMTTGWNVKHCQINNCFVYMMPNKEFDWFVVCVVVFSPFFFFFAQICSVVEAHRYKPLNNHRFYFPRRVQANCKHIIWFLFWLSPPPLDSGEQVVSYLYNKEGYVRHLHGLGITIPNNLLYVLSVELKRLPFLDITQ